MPGIVLSTLVSAKQINERKFAINHAADASFCREESLHRPQPPISMCLLDQGSNTVVITSTLRAEPGSNRSTS